MQKEVVEGMDKLFKLKPGFILRKIAGSDIVIPIGENIANFNGLITLNETAAFLFKLLGEGASMADMIEALIKEYHIDRDLACKDTHKFITELKNADMLMEM